MNKTIIYLSDHIIYFKNQNRLESKRGKHSRNTKGLRMEAD